LKKFIAQAAPLFGAATIYCSRNATTHNTTTTTLVYRAKDFGALADQKESIPSPV